MGFLVKFFSCSQHINTGLFGLNGSTLYLDYLESTKPMLKGWLQEIFLLKIHFFSKNGVWPIFRTYYLEKPDRSE
jgi:hypothetical protein